MSYIRSGLGRHPPREGGPKEWAAARREKALARRGSTRLTPQQRAESTARRVASRGTKRPPVPCNLYLKPGDGRSFVPASLAACCNAAGIADTEACITTLAEARRKGISDELTLLKMGGTVPTNPTASSLSTPGGTSVPGVPGVPGAQVPGVPGVPGAQAPGVQPSLFSRIPKVAIYGGIAVVALFVVMNLRKSEG